MTVMDGGIINKNYNETVTEEFVIVTVLLSSCLILAAI
jgi:hypothetical protein